MAQSRESVPNSQSPALNNQAMEPASPRNPMEVLMQVEVPVSVSLGRTRMRMKDLLGLAHGSVVELDEYVGDEVQILVNKQVLAHGEVVAVDGYYGVRITRMGGGSNPPPSVVETSEEP
jgi:flagellar motor switch protein FliN